MYFIRMAAHLHLTTNLSQQLFLIYNIIYFSISLSPASHKIISLILIPIFQLPVSYSIFHLPAFGPLLPPPTPTLGFLLLISLLSVPLRPVLKSRFPASHLPSPNSQSSAFLLPMHSRSFVSYLSTLSSLLPIPNS